ncbi:hypothetical protein ABIB25_001408 [Nakamurella sp. UYEF19]
MDHSLGTACARSGLAGAGSEIGGRQRTAGRAHRRLGYRGLAQ